MNINLQKPKIHNSVIIAQSNLFTIESVDLEFSNGERRIYERMKPVHPESVMIVPILNNNLFLIREYNVGVERYEIGFPKGLINPGEMIMEAANRELTEEIGYAGHTFTFVRSLSTISSYFSNKTYIVIAKDLYPKRLKGDEPEHLDLLYWPINHMLELLSEPDFCEARNVSALFLVNSWINKSL